MLCIYHRQVFGRTPTYHLINTGSSSYAYSTKAFLFSLYNTHGYSPIKLPAVQNHQYAIYRGSGYGPTFGGGHDMYISNHASSYGGAYFYVYTYKAPPACSYEKEMNSNV
ncbi:hypothetical protein AC249_AIPGENE11243 [Exaiptasia diaphana]|nr:hypothetical protein AC249_AIPGENE11243 [Exaiptasia diaphana]